MRTKNYEDLVRDMEPGLERACIQVLRFHIGKGKAIKKEKILAELKRIGYFPHERQFRLAVANLRRSGWLICSYSAIGYFLAETQKEYEDFRDEELVARITDLSETRKVMDAASRERFGEAVQVGLL